MTLDDLLGMVNDPYLLKMNCEGCEYDAILNSKRLGELKRIQMEYHYGPERLVEALRSTGFEVEATRPQRNHSPRTRDPNMLLGYIYARKRELRYVH
ncbi:MAG: hypothetical protein RXP86_08955 [Acidilobus sp.]